tara:strand:+ start:8 stop:253 length:246 start_codon:yes stop_codon:yes gene_type:complete
MKTKNKTERVKYVRDIFTEYQKQEIINYFLTLKDNRTSRIADLMGSTISRVETVINHYLKEKSKKMRLKQKLEEKKNENDK